MADEAQPVTLRLDFVADWTAHVRRALTAAGFKGPFDDAAVAMAWFNLRGRALSAMARRTLRAREFQCPPAFAQSVAALVSDSEAGHSLIGYLSKKIAFDAMYTDGLLNDWQIHHFHLGGTFEPSGFVKRTKALLFGLVTTDTFYLLQVGDHDDFSRSELLERIARNWPALFEQRRLDADDLRQGPISDAERSALRKGGAYAPTVVDGHAYIPAGMGAVMSGTSVKVIVQVQQLYYDLQHLEAQARERAGEIAAAIREAGHAVGTELPLMLDFLPAGPVIRHPNSGIALELSNTPGSS